MLISIIVPVYNVAPYIERCLRSVMGQTYTGDVECLLVDDCGNDDSMTIAERMIGAYKGPIQFRILLHEHNRGLSAARNTGTDAAIGDYIFYLDSDDELTTDCIEKLANPLIEDKTIEMVMGNRIVRSDCNSIFVPYKKGSKLHDEDVISSEAVRSYLFDRWEYKGNVWNKLIKKKFLIHNQLFFKEGLLFEDLLWNFYVMKYLSHLCVISDVTYIYLKRPNSIMTGTSREKELRHKKMIYEEIANNLTVDDSIREAKHYLKRLSAVCIKFPDSEALHAIAKKMMMATGEGYSFEKLLYYVSSFLSRFSAGRQLLQFGIKVRRMIRELMG